MLFYESTDKLRSQNGAGNEGRSGLLVRQDAVTEGGQRYEYTSSILNTFQQSVKTAFRRKRLSVLTHWPFFMLQTYNTSGRLWANTLFVIEDALKDLDKKSICPKSSRRIIRL